MISVSIIVPVYNVEKYLEKCLSSLISQSLKNIEILLINDGSTDGSLSICKKYEEMDDRVKIFNKVNGGVSSARNLGLKVAQGEYIAFVDPDDWIEEFMYKNMYKFSKDYNTDIVMCNYKQITNEKECNILIPTNKKVLNNKDIINNLIPKMISSSDLNSKSDRIMGVVWRLLIKKDLIKSSNITFNEDIHLMEDLIFCIEALLKSDSVGIDNNLYYNYRDNNNSAVKKYRHDMSEVHINVYKEIEKILIKYGIKETLETNMNIRYVEMKLELISNEVNPNSNKKIIEKIRSISNICKDDKLLNILSKLDKSEYTLRKTIVLWALYNSNSLFLFSYYNILKNLKYKFN